MTTTRSRSRHAPLAAALILVSTAGVVACDSDDGGVTTGEVQLESAGAERGRVQLPGPAEVGSQGAASADVDMTVTVDGREAPIHLRLDYEGAVVAADADGFTMESTFTDAAVLDAPEGADSDELDSVSDIVGVTYRQRFDTDGGAGEAELVDGDQVTSAQRAAYESFGKELDSAAFSYPQEPVGEGAKWSSVATLRSQGLEVEVTYHYELTELDGKDYTVEIAYDQDIDTTLEGADVTGTITGGGTSGATIGDPMSQRTSLRQDLVMTVADGSDHAEMTMGIVIGIIPQAA